jgi:hypothetical protein
MTLTDLSSKYAKTLLTNNSLDISSALAFGTKCYSTVRCDPVSADLTFYVINPLHFGPSTFNHLPAWRLSLILINPCIIQIILSRVLVPCRTGFGLVNRLIGYSQIVSSNNYNTLEITATITRRNYIIC